MLGAIDYNADGYQNDKAKLSMLSRLLPFVEKRVNLIELAPKGTGKSYLFGRISKYGNLTAGVMSRAKLFYDLSKRTYGLIYNNDYVAFDEIQKLAFADPDEMSQTLKGYMEQGIVSFGGHTGTPEAGIILLGNIPQDNMNEFVPMFGSLPALFKESALLDRFHGFIKGFLGLLYRIVYRPKVVGLENFPKDEGFIICANHMNALDAAGLILCNKFKIRFIAKADLFRFGILSYLGHIFDIIPVKRASSDINSIKLCLKALKNNEILGIFPEGTRKGLAKNVKIKNGAVFLAEKANVKIIPVGISGSFKPFTKVYFHYGKPIDIKEFKEKDEDWLDKASSRVMNDIIMLTKKTD